MNTNRDSLLDSVTEQGVLLDISGKIDPLVRVNESCSLQVTRNNGLQDPFEPISGNISELKPANNLDLNESSFRLDIYQYFGKSISAALNLHSEVPINKRSRLEESSESEEPRVYTIEEQKAAFMKQVSKIKYYWRGTNINYPFAFHKFFKICKRKRNGKRLLDLCEKSRFSCLFDQDNEEEDNYYLLLEDYSNKLINPAEKLLK